MSKLWPLVKKEVRLAFRDRGNLLSMIVTPLVLTIAIAAAFGGRNGQLSEIHVLLLNYDEQELSASFVQTFRSEQLEGLIALEEVEDETLARQRIDRDEVAALVIIPHDFSTRMLPLLALEQEIDIQGLLAGEVRADDLTSEQFEIIRDVFADPPSDQIPATVTIYASPSFRISTAVVQAVVSQVLDQMYMTIQGTQIVMTQWISENPTLLDQPERLFEIGEALSAALYTERVSEDLLHLEIDTGGLRPFRWIDYLAANMAVLSTMFTATAGGRSLLAEREAGTLQRLLITPTPAHILLVGKMAGVAATGTLQLLILWKSSGLVGAYWGETVPVVAAILALALCATGVGALISAWARTPTQASALGTGVSLAAAALSGSFFPRNNLPMWVQRLSLVTPNAWGIEMFARLQSGYDLSQALPTLGGILLLTLGYYIAATIGFRRQFGT